MASLTGFWLTLTLVFCNSLFVTAAAADDESLSGSFRLSSVRKAHGSSISPAAAAFRQSLRGSAHGDKRRTARAWKQSSYSSNYSLKFKYTMALILSLPIGTPPQNQSMVLDTGSQLSWINCNQTQTRPIESTRRRTQPFITSMSSSFSPIACNNSCPRQLQDPSLSPTCAPEGHCHFSFFYADGLLAEGKFVHEVLSLSKSRPPNSILIGCMNNSKEAEGILGMNQGDLSFASQKGISTFSYCVPLRRNLTGKNPDGAFLLGPNPSASNFKYINLLDFTESQKTLPNLDEFAYTVNMTAIRIAGNTLNISAAVFLPDDTGSGQTMIDSGTEYTYLVDDAYNRVVIEVTNRIDKKLKSAIWSKGNLEMCFNGSAKEIGRVVGNMTFVFDNGVEIVIPEERMADEVESGLSCLGIGSSATLSDDGRNIIGNFHQQNLWVEFDLTKRRVGFGRADCSRALL